MGERVDGRTVKAVDAVAFNGESGGPGGQARRGDGRLTAADGLTIPRPPAALPRPTIAVLRAGTHVHGGAVQLSVELFEETGDVLRVERSTADHPRSSCRDPGCRC